MLEALASLVEAFIAAAKAVLERRESIDRGQLQLALLTAHFCFVGISETGEELLELAGPRPLRKLEGMNGDERKEFHALAQRHMSIQLARLKKLQAIIEDQQVVELFAPDLRRKIRRAIGGKHGGLTQIGAGLFFYFIFNSDPTGEKGDQSSRERTAGLIASMYPEVEDGLIAVERAKADLLELRRLAVEYGDVVRQLIPANDILTMSKRASELAGVDGNV